MRVFISHSSKDSKLAEEICTKLEQKGCSCFLASRDIRYGHEYAEEIINGIDETDVILLLLSEAANSSPHVLREIERAVSKKKPIIVYKMEEVALSKSLEYFLMTHQWFVSKPGKSTDEIVQFIVEQAGNKPAEPEQSDLSQKADAVPEDGKRKKVLFEVILAAVVLVAAGVILAVSLLSGGSGGESQPDTVPESGSTAGTAAESGTSAAENEQTSAPETVTGQTSAAPTSATEPPEEPIVTDASTAPALTAQSEPAEEVILPADTEPESKPEQAEQKLAAVELGDRITFGSYNGEPIEWRIVHISDDKTQAVVISDKILTMKAFDAAEGGKYNSYNGEDHWRTRPEEIDEDIQRAIRGDNRWELSNIRTWLNSDREMVSYSDQAPISQAMSERRNGYHTEAGFLNGFTDEELSAVAVTPVTTGGTVTEDRVFLLSLDELQWLYEADVSVYAKPTKAAQEQDKSLWYNVDVSAYGVEDFFWWLREPNSENACECYYVNISYSDQQTAFGSVGLEGYGIRPAMTLDLTSDALISALENN